MFTNGNLGRNGSTLCDRHVLGSGKWPDLLAVQWDQYPSRLLFVKFDKPDKPKIIILCSNTRIIIYLKIGTLECIINAILLPTIISWSLQLI